jgi:hypothetical protein
MELRKLLLIVALATMVAITTGCAGKYTGGGWMKGIDGESKANFGFEAQYDVTRDGDCVSGQVQYNDRSECGYMFHGEIEGYVPVSHNEAWLCGTATIMPEKLCCNFWLYAEDNGKPGTPDEADYLAVGLYDNDPFHPFYINGGNLCGGNIVYHPPGED